MRWKTKPSVKAFITRTSRSAASRPQRRIGLIFLAHNMVDLAQMMTGIGSGVWAGIGAFKGPHRAELELKEPSPILLLLSNHIRSRRHPQ